MANNQNWAKIRDDIKNSVQDVLETGDFSSTVQTLADTASVAIEEAKYQLEKSYSNAHNKELRYRNTQDYIAYRSGSSQAPFNAGANRAYPGAQPNTYQGYNVYPYRARLPKVFTRAGELGSVLKLVAGVPLAFIFGIASLGVVPALFFGTAAAEMGTAIGATLISLALFGASMYMNISAMKNLQRISLGKKYIELIGNKTYINISNLAMLTGESPKRLIENLKKIIRQGIFPEAHLDAEEKCLIMTNQSYREYLSIMQERKNLELTGTQQMQKNALEMNSEAASLSEEDRKKWYDMINDGQEYVEKLRALNEDIEGEQISIKLSKLESLLQSIFNRIREKPGETSQMHKFMEYYLPTTLKLVQTYKEFDSVIDPDRDVLSAKLEIESTLDTINQAFSELLNKLFRSSVYDASTDAQVLQTMLAKEGLVNQMNGRQR